MSIISLDKEHRGLIEHINKKKYDSNTLSYRLLLSLKFLNVSQSELARRVGMKPQIIQYLCTKNVNNSKFTFELAEALGIDFTWLSTGIGNMLPSQGDLNEVKIPLLNWNKLDFLLNEEGNYSHQGEYIYFNGISSGKYYGIHIDDTSMEPRFSKPTILIFDILEKPRDGDFVLAWIKHLKTWLFRKFIQQTDMCILAPLNKDLYKEINLNRQDIIAGVLIQTICNFKNRV